MKKSEIVVGGVYEGKSGKPRMVVDEGDFVNCRWQEDRDCVLWQHAGKSVENRATRASFAKWAIRRVE